MGSVWSDCRGTTRRCTGEAYVLCVGRRARKQLKAADVDGGGADGDGGGARTSESQTHGRHRRRPRRPRSTTSSWLPSHPRPWWETRRPQWTGEGVVDLDQDKGGGEAGVCRSALAHFSPQADPSVYHVTSRWCWLVLEPGTTSTSQRTSQHSDSDWRTGLPTSPGISFSCPPW